MIPFPGGFDDTTTFGVANVTVVAYIGCNSTMVATNYDYITYDIPPRFWMPPKNWRWFDVYRLLLAPLIPAGAAIMVFARMRMPTGVSMAQAARQRRRLAFQRMRR